MSTGAQREQQIPNLLSEAERSPSGGDRSRSPRRPLKGASTTTVQISLHPKASELEPSKSSWDASIQSLELGEGREGAKNFTLPPADEGFGAWSYVASAFSMFIVVWGKELLQLSEFEEIQLLTLSQRLPSSVSHLSDLSLRRSFSQAS